MRSICKWALLSCAAIALWAQPEPNAVAQHARAAQLAQKSGDFPAAIREYTELTRLLPNVAEVHSNLGIAYFFSGQRKQALDAFGQALRLNSNLASALIFSGIAQHDLGQQERAVELLERAVKLSPSDALARTWLGFSYLDAGRPQDAVPQFKSASQLQPDSADAWYGLGTVYLELGRRETKRLAGAAPDSARLLQLTGDLWRLRGDEAKAGLLYAAAEQRKSSSDGDMSYRAITDFRKRSQEALAKVAALGAHSPRAHQVMAESLALQRKTVEAVEEYRAALRLNPYLGRVHESIGDLLLSEGKAGEALKEFRLELAYRPDDATLHYRIGRCLTVLGDDQAADVSFRQAIALPSPPPRALRELAKLQMNRRQYSDAVGILGKYLQSNPQDASAHYLLMRAYTSLGNTAAAECERLEFQSLSDRRKKLSSANEALSFFLKTDGDIE